MLNRRVVIGLAIAWNLLWAALIVVPAAVVIGWILIGPRVLYAPFSWGRPAPFPATELCPGFPRQASFEAARYAASGQALGWKPLTYRDGSPGRAAVSGYEILGHPGDLTLSFARDRLYSCHFEPMDFEAVASDLEKAFDISPGSLRDGAWYHPDAYIRVAATRGEDGVWFLAFSDEDLD